MGERLISKRLLYLTLSLILAVAILYPLYIFIPREHAK